MEKEDTIDNISYPIPKPRITGKGVAISAFCWLLYATSYSLMVASSGQSDFISVYSGQVVAVIIMVVLSIGPWWLVVRQMEPYRWPVKILAHIIIAPLFSWVALELFLMTIYFSTSPGVYDSVVEAYSFLFGANITAYIVQFSLLHAYWIFQRLRLKEKQAAELQALAKESELAALKAQINPHFLFNTLNSINAMVKQDPEETRTMIMQLGDLLRYALDSSRKDLVTLKEELDFAAAYLELESHRFAERLQVDFDLAGKLEEVLIPPMVLQPLIENAIKHSIAKREAGGKITIRVKEVAGFVNIGVEDVGNGSLDTRQQTASHGIGLANTSSRLEKRLGPVAALKTEDLSPAGFKVYFSIPHLSA